MTEKDLATMFLEEEPNDKKERRKDKKKKKEKKKEKEKEKEKKVEQDTKKKKKKKKKKKDSNKRKRQRDEQSQQDEASNNDSNNTSTDDSEKQTALVSSSKRQKQQQQQHDDAKKAPCPKDEALSSLSLSSSSSLVVDYRWVLAPMVGASELAFRLLCRKYGATLAYTPMMSSSRFVHEPSYRRAELPVHPHDRPLVCHFSANHPATFAQAARLCAPHCDAIDLNLGCPQRTAYVGNFGSYLLGPDHRRLVLDMVQAAVEAVPTTPICVKIRLLDTVDDTVELCRQLHEAGAAWIAIHGRFRATFHRNGPGARDGPALLDHIRTVQQRLPHVPILTNGNVVTYQDVVDNQRYTGANGVMSAEGILDNPALFLPRHGNNPNQPIPIPDTSLSLSSLEPDDCTTSHNGNNNNNNNNSNNNKNNSNNSNKNGLSNNTEDQQKRKRRKLLKKLREIERIQEKKQPNLNPEQVEKLKTKDTVLAQLKQLEEEEQKEQQQQEQQQEPQVDSNNTTTTNNNNNNNNNNKLLVKHKTVRLQELQESARDPLGLAREYLGLVRRYPAPMRTVVFHTRRMLRDWLNQYQLMEECVASTSLEDVESVLDRIGRYRTEPASFLFDVAKARRQKQLLEQKKREEGKRRAYQNRMLRKAKREGKPDPEHYLRIGTQIPTVETVQRLRQEPHRPTQIQLWKQLNHSQHCLAYHVDPQGCPRDRTCAFLHVDAQGKNTFDEQDEVAG